MSTLTLPALTRRCMTAALTLVLAACGASERSAPGTASAVAKADRYALANGCFAIRSPAGYVVAGASGVALDGAAAAATPFFLKATGLGTYVFYAPDRRYLSLPAANDAAADSLGAGIQQAGWEVAGVGDQALWAPPQVDAAGNSVDQAGDAIAAQGPLAADRLRGARSLAMTAAPTDASEWTVDTGNGGFTVVSTLTGDPLGAAGAEYAFAPASGCTPYPEAQLNAVGEPFRGTNPDGTVFGYAETHMHLGGSHMLGGRMSYGAPFHKFGIEHALGNCEVDHGKGGVLDALDAVVNKERNYMPPHDTVGWPTYKDWPSWGGQTHHQTYYVWLQRAWMGGLRLMVNHFVANEELCQLWPYRQYDCNEMESIQLQYDLVRGLQDYIDAQAGGPGKGFFRIVTSSAEARRVIEDGKLAVVLGTENEKVFDCGEYLDQPLCTKAHIDEQLDAWYARGLRSVFPIHLEDNAFGGTRLAEDAALSGLYQAANTVATGHPYATIPCDQVDARAAPGQAKDDPNRGIFDTLLLQVMGPPPAPPATGCVRNARGLTELGDYFVNALIDRGIMIETDHTGELARRRIFDIAAARGVGVLSGHTGEISAAKDSRRILEIGGVISNLPDEPSPATVSFIQDLIKLYREVHGSTAGLGTGMGADINGIHNQPPPRPDAAQRPLIYPFKSYDGRVTFEREVTGERVFDLNVDGVAHYGLYPDFIADMRMQPGGDEAVQYLFRSAEAYLKAWERAEAAARR